LQSSPGPVKVPPSTLVTRWYDPSWSVPSVTDLGPQHVSLGAYGLLVYLAALPRATVTSVNEVSRACWRCLPYQIRGYFAELERAGLLVRTHGKAGPLALRIAVAYTDEESHQ
jgi:hypothetical protein